MVIVLHRAASFCSSPANSVNCVYDPGTRPDRGNCDGSKTAPTQPPQKPPPPDVNTEDLVLQTAFMYSARE